MAIDVRTLVLIIGISHLLQVLVLFNQYKANKNLLGPGWWLMWSSAEALGFILILLRSIPSLIPMVIIFQDIVIFSGTIFIYIGIVRFFNKKVNLKLITYFFVSFVILHLFFFFVKNDILIRTLIFDAYLSVIAFLTAIFIYKNKTSSIALAANFNIVIFIVHGIIFCFRFIMILFGSTVFEMFSPTLFNLLQYFDGLIVGLLWTFGFIIMLNQKLNAEISEVKVHFEQIFNTSPDAVVISRLSDGMFVECNEGFTKISGYTKKEILDKSSLDINIWKNPSDRFEVVKMIKIKGSYENFEFPFQRKGGEVITGLMSGKILTLKGIPHIISVTRDISDRKIADQVIKLKNEELIKLNLEKDKFFSIIAHDLRGPFSGFLGQTQIMAEDSHSLTMLEVKEFAVSLNKSADSLYRLLNNLLEWSQIQKGSVVFTPAAIQLRSLVDESMVMIIESAKTKGIEINYDIRDDITVFADNNILQTVIRNLVSNAVKFTPRNGKIDLSAKTLSDKSIEICVRDSGIGINPSMVDDLFRLDVQTNRKGTEGEPSSGLGLLLCKEFIEKHGGKIWVESEEGIGSAFYFTLPYHVKPEEKFLTKNAIPDDGAERKMNPEVAGLKILIVEDDKASEILISKMVEMVGREILKVRTGIEAVEACHNNPDLNLILMDIQMPGLNGYEATRQIRQFNKNVVIIAQTAYAQTGDREKSIAEGCNDYIAKPILKDELLALIQKYFKE